MEKQTMFSAQPNKPKYWIIVSNEGHSRVPHQHTTLSSAQAEAARLTTEHPGITFTIFEALQSLKTPTAATESTVYVAPPAPYSYLYRFANSNSKDDIPF